MPTDWNAVQAFMAAVVPWPTSPQDVGYVNLQNSYVSNKTPDGKVRGKYPVSPGWPFRVVDQLVSRAAWVNTTPNMKDVWYCLSLQSTAKASPKTGKLTAVRARDNALKVKAIWVDMDVGAGPKKYPTVEDALKTIIEFKDRHGLPHFSAIVGSGSGIHVYWISDVALLPTEWAGYANGLKALLLQDGVRCDAGLTTDVARILRVPGTFNHKSDPPKPVQLFNLPLVVYKFDEAIPFLKAVVPAGGPTGVAKIEHQLFADGVSLASFGKPAFTVAGPDLNAGIDKYEDALLAVEPIFRQCGFYKEALLTGGANYAEPLWMLSVLGTTFMENGNAVAHAISKGHATYSPGDTQALYDRKVADRADRGIGYPSCATIAGAGCSSCATCPLFSKGKSPLNIRPAPPPHVTAAVTTQQTPAAQALNLPDTFDVNDDGIICKVIVKALADGETSTTYIPLFLTVLSNLWVQKNPDKLNYTVVVDKGFTHDASVPHAEMSKNGFRAYLGSEECRTLINTAGAAYLEEFFLSTLAKLRALAAAQEAVPFGWYTEGGVTRGFVYGGKIMMDDGTTRPCGTGDVNIKNMYTPTGDIQPWFDACRTVTDRKRPELTAIMLMSFASPLIKLSGKDSAFYSVWGTSGSGKSSAYKVGMAVWGHPKLTKGSEQSTRNNITTQMSEVRNLPLYWDEISEEKRELVAQVMHEASDGAQKGRNLTGQKTAKRGSWELMIMAASNGSFKEFLAERDRNNTASTVRCFEWKAQRIDGGPGHMDDATATQILARLENNYGQMGLRYAEFLALNHVQIEAECIATANAVQKDFAFGSSERYWITNVALMILAARYAKQLGVDVDENEIKTFLYKAMRANTEERANAGYEDGDEELSCEEVLARYLKERGAEERVIWTNYMHNVPGKPPKPVQIIKPPGQARNNIGGIEVRVAIENREIVIARRDLDPWVKKHGHSKTQILDGLVKEFGARIENKLRLLSGTTFGVGNMREPGVIIPVTPASILWDYVMMYTDPVEREKIEAAYAAGSTPTDTVVETGITDGA